METNGIVYDDISRKLSESKVERDWISAVSGLRSEQKIFDQIQQTLNPATCLLINNTRSFRKPSYEVPPPYMRDPSLI